MKKSVGRICFFSLICMHALLYAQTEEYQNVLHKPGDFSAENFHFISPEFRVNTFNGGLEISYELIRIRGRNKLDLVVSMHYSSKNTYTNGPMSPLRAKGWAGRGWTLQLGKLDLINSEVSLEDGMSREFGKSKELYPNTTGNPDVFITQNFEKIYKLGYNAFELIVPGGKRFYRFTHNYEEEDDPTALHLNGLYATRIFNDFQDTLFVEYQEGTCKISRISDILERSVTFEYYTNDITDGMLKRLHYRGVEGDARSIEFTYNELGEMLSSIRMPNGKTTSFLYENQNGVMTDITQPTGGTTRIGYVTKAFEDHGGPQGSGSHDVFVQCVSTLDSDYDSDGLMERIQYQYTCQEAYPYLYQTSLLDQAGNETLILHEHINSQNNLKCRAGRVREKYYYDGRSWSGNLLKQELNVWGSYLFVFTEDNETPLFAPVLLESAEMYGDSGAVTTYLYDGVKMSAGTGYEYRIGYNYDYNVDFEDPHIMSFMNHIRKVRLFNAKQIGIDISNHDFNLPDTLVYDDTQSRKIEEKFSYLADPPDLTTSTLEYYGENGYKFFLDRYYVNQTAYYEKTGEDGSYLTKHNLYDVDLTLSRNTYYGYLTDRHQGLLKYILTNYSGSYTPGIPDTIFMEYDQFGNHILYKGERGQQIEWEYDETYCHAYPTQEINSVYGTRCRVSYDYDTGMIINYEDQNGNVTHYSYDVMSNLSRVQKPGDSKEYPSIRIDYDYSGNRIEYRTKRTAEEYYKPVSYFYNKYGKLTQIQEQIDGSVCFCRDILYDKRNLNYLESKQYRRSGYGMLLDADTTVFHSSYAYDGLNRLIRTTHPGHSSDQPSQKTIHYQGLAEQHIDENGREKRILFSTEIKKITEEQYIGNDPVVTHFRYDDFGNLTRVTDPNGQVTLFSYSGTGNLLSRESADPGPVEWSYRNDRSAGYKIITKNDAKTDADQDYRAQEVIYDQLDRNISRRLLLEDDQEDVQLIDGFEGGDEVKPYSYYNAQYDCNVKISCNHEKFHIAAYSLAHGGSYCSHIESFMPGEELVVEYTFEPSIDLSSAKNLTMFALENAGQEDYYAFSLIVKVRDLSMNEYVYSPQSGGPLGLWREFPVVVKPCGGTELQWNRVNKLTMTFFNPSEASTTVQCNSSDNYIEGLYPQPTRSFYLDDLTAHNVFEGGYREVYRAWCDNGVGGFDQNPVGHIVKEAHYNTSFSDQKLNAEIFYDYDKRNHVCKQKMEIRQLIKQFEFVYDHSDKLSNITYPDGFSVSYSYNGNQQLEVVRDGATGNDIVRYAYHDDGLVKTISYHNGIYPQYNYDYFTYYPRSWIKQIQMNKYRYLSGGGNVIDAYTRETRDVRSGKLPVKPPGGTHTSQVIWKKYYTYDPAGNLLTIQESDATGPLTTQFEYDDLNRLNSEMYFGMNSATRDLTYDKAGNILRIGITGEDYDYSRDYEYADDNPNRMITSEITGVSFPESERDYLDIDYDETGNIAYFKWYKDNEQGESFFEYDHLGRLTKIHYDCLTDNSLDMLILFAYDHNGNRVYSEVNGQPSWYFYVDNRLMAEYDQNRNLKYYYIYANGKRVARRNASGTFQYYRHDYLGNVRLITDYKGNAVCTYDYYAFGEDRLISGQSDNRFKYSAKQKYSDIGIYYFGARWYDPGLGRWLSVDPLQDTYASLNPYNYAANNPLFYIDPDGRGLKDLYENLKFRSIVGALLSIGTNYIADNLEPGKKRGAVRLLASGLALASSTQAITAGVGSYICALTIAPSGPAAFVMIQVGNMFFILGTVEFVAAVEYFEMALEDFKAKKSENNQSENTTESEDNGQAQETNDGDDSED